MMGSLSPMFVCMRVMMPDTKKIVQMVLARSAGYNREAKHRCVLIEAVRKMLGS